MLSIAICDDEVIECSNMAKRIKEIMEEMKMPCIIRQFQSGRELLQALESFDIIFLDIIMQELDGMKTAQLFRKKAFDKILVFVSSSREYVFEAYDVEAFQYLLKPVDGRLLEISEEGKVLLKDSIGLDDTVSAETKTDAVREPVTYTKTGETVPAEQSTNTSISVSV